MVPVAKPDLFCLCCFTWLFQPSEFVCSQWIHTAESPGLSHVLADPCSDFQVGLGVSSQAQSLFTPKSSCSQRCLSCPHLSPQSSHNFRAALYHFAYGFVKQDGKLMSRSSVSTFQSQDKWHSLQVACIYQLTFGLIIIAFGVMTGIIVI